MEQLIYNSEQIKVILEKYFVSKIGVFGSVARNEANSNSDIDILVKFSKTQGLLTLIKLEKELEICFGRNVDLITENSLSPYLKNSIFNELKIIYEEK